MSAPKLVVASSGFGGRGYRNPWTKEVVPSVTTALGALDKPGVLQWSVDQVAAYAAVHAEALLSRSEDQAYRMLRFYHSRAKERDFDDPMVDLRNAHTGVLNDLAELGTAVHEWIEADLNGWIEPNIYREEQEQMIVSYLEWKSEHDIEVTATEATVFGSGYAGTSDAFLKIDGVHTLVDVKTSRAVRDEHVAQLAALGAADLIAQETTEDHPEAVGHKPRKADKEFSSWWLKDVMPPVQQYAVLQVRPDDYATDGTFIPSFCELHMISQARIDAGFELFKGALQARYAQKLMREASKRHGTNA